MDIRYDLLANGVAVTSGERSEAACESYARFYPVSQMVIYDNLSGAVLDWCYLVWLKDGSLVEIDPIDAENGERL